MRHAAAFEHGAFSATEVVLFPHQIDLDQPADLHDTPDLVPQRREAHHVCVSEVTADQPEVGHAIALLVVLQANIRDHTAERAGVPIPEESIAQARLPELDVTPRVELRGVLTLDDRLPHGQRLEGARTLPEVIHIDSELGPEG